MPEPAPRGVTGTRCSAHSRSTAATSAVDAQRTAHSGGYATGSGLSSRAYSWSRSSAGPITRSAPSSRSRIAAMLGDVTGRGEAMPWLYREARAAAAGALHVRVVELEARALQPLDVVDHRAREVHQAHLVDDDVDAVDREPAIDLGGLVEVEVVREPGAAAADDAQPQRHVGLDRLGGADLVDLRGRQVGDPDHPRAVHHGSGARCRSLGSRFHGANLTRTFG